MTADGHGLVSVIMPVRNAAATLPAALDSIRSQTLPDWELIVVNDGSTDLTADILLAAARRDGRVRVFQQPPRGVAEALRLGCEQARGAFFARMDADDWMAPERLERQLRFLRQNPETGLVSCRVRYGGDPAAAGYAEHVAWINSLDSARISLRRFVESPVAHPSVMFRRDVIERWGGYRDGDFPEDYELWLRWLDAGVCFARMPQELLIWNDSPSRLSRTDLRYRVEAFYRLKCEYLARWIRRHLAPQRRVWLWGAGRITRLRFRELESHGVALAGFVDIDRAKAGRVLDGRPIVLPNRLPPQEESFIIAGVGTRGARDLIALQLLEQGRREGDDFLLAA
jgi:glycosyltransferase involved in cell wall biosynthesis